MGSVITFDSVDILIGGPNITITLDSYVSDLVVRASCLFIATDEDVSDAGPGCRCMLRLQPFGNTPDNIELNNHTGGRMVRFHKLWVAVYRNGGDARTVVYGTPPDESQLANFVSNTTLHLRPILDYERMLYTFNN